MSVHRGIAGVESAGADGRRDRATRVAYVLATHQEGTDGWCTGCAKAGILTFHPCPSATWAAKAGQEYGMVVVSSYHGVPTN